MTTVSLRMPEDVVEELKRIAPLLGFSGYQPLIRAYIGQGMRQDLERLARLSGTSTPLLPIDPKLSQASLPADWSREEIYDDDDG